MRKHHELGSLEATEDAAELHAIANGLREEATFGVDSGAAVTVIGPDVASDYPHSHTSTRKRMTDCQGNAVTDMGEKDFGIQR